MVPQVPASPYRWFRIRTPAPASPHGRWAPASRPDACHRARFLRATLRVDDALLASGSLPSILFRAAGAQDDGLRGLRIFTVVAISSRVPLAAFSPNALALNVVSADARFRQHVDRRLGTGPADWLSPVRHRACSAFSLQISASSARSTFTHPAGAILRSAAEIQTPLKDNSAGRPELLASESVTVDRHPGVPGLFYRLLILVSDAYDLGWLAHAGRYCHASRVRQSSSERLLDAGCHYATTWRSAAAGWAPRQSASGPLDANRPGGVSSGFIGAGTSADFVT